MKSLYDLLGSSKKKAIQDLIGRLDFEGDCLVSANGDKLAFIQITPINPNVLSSTVIRSRVMKLSDSIKTLGTVEFICINSSQSYDSNKEYLTALRDKESNDTLRSLDEQDIAFFDEIRVTMATSREFLAGLRFNQTDTQEHITEVAKKAIIILQEGNLTVKRASRADVKRLLAIYFEQNIFEAETQNYDGERYAGILEMNT